MEFLIKNGKIKRTMENIESKIQDIFRKVFDDNQLIINETMTANDVDKWDSLSHLTMISEVETTFGIRFKLKELIKMKNVGDLLALVKEKTA